MTSECFVYITLPGRTEAVTAGKFRQTTDRHGTVIGEFVYGKTYLANPDRVELDPVELRLRVRGYSTTRLGGTFGALRDAAPDLWGRKLIEKRLGTGLLPEIQYLLNSPDDRAGALGFGLNSTPPAPIRQFNRTVDLEKLMELADRIIASENDPDAPKPADPDAEQAELLIRAGTSMGGARPKATVEHDDCLWLAKFSRADDRWSNPRVEHAVMTLARECGISTAVTRVVTVGDRDAILVKRFDREQAENGWLRTRMISGLTMLNADEDERTKWSYLLLADELRRCAAHDQGRELAELFRRITFNALISNTDDHPRNHAVLARGRGWTLSPAYDLTPTPAIATERHLAMSLGDQGRRATRSNLLSRCDRFLLGREEAERIADNMAETVRSAWYGIARNAGVSERDCEIIRNAFVSEGFAY